MICLVFVSTVQGSDTTKLNACSIVRYIKILLHAYLIFNVMMDATTNNIVMIQNLTAILFS
jgi:hypothetical protein